MIISKRFAAHDSGLNMIKILKDANGQIKRSLGKKENCHFIVFLRNVHVISYAYNAHIYIRFVQTD